MDRTLKNRGEVEVSVSDEVMADYESENLSKVTKSPYDSEYPVHWALNSESEEG